MSKSLKQLLPQKKRWWALIIIAGIVIAMIAFGKEEEDAIKPIDYDPETTPTMFTAEALSYVSDSGYTRYYIEAKQWYIFDEARDPNWKFPQGLYGEKFDNNMNVIATFECDSAVYLSVRRLWELIGNVRINNEAGDRFMTQHLFWDSSDHKMYSDSFIHIEKSDRVIEGYGFVSDEKITDYVVHKPSMIIPASELRRDNEEATDSVDAPIDSLAQENVSRKPPRPRQGYAPQPQSPAMPPSIKAPTPGGHTPGTHNAKKPRSSDPKLKGERLKLQESDMGKLKIKPSQMK